jgi:hypothetical protein
MFLFIWNDEQLWQVLIDNDVDVPGADDGLSGLDGWRFGGEEDSPSLPIDTEALERLHFSMEVLSLSLKILSSKLRLDPFCSFSCPLASVYDLYSFRSSTSLPFSLPATFSYTVCECLCAVMDKSSTN